MLLIFLFSFVYVLGIPVASLFLDLILQFRTVLQMLLEFTLRNIKPFLIRTLHFTLKVTTMRSTILWPNHRDKFAHSFFPLNIHLTYSLLFLQPLLSLLLFYLHRVFLHEVVIIQELIRPLINRNNWNRKSMSKAFQKANRKEVRKPVAEKFAPKRLAINFDPPTISTSPSIQSWNIWQLIQANSITTKCD